MAVDKTDVNRSVYRELFNNLCADYSIYRLHHHEVNEEFVEIERKLWEYREKALFMGNSDIAEFETFLVKGEIYINKLKNPQL